jgi:hypothetical protein
MSIDVQIPKVKWTMLQWNSTKERPENYAKILLDRDGEILGGRYIEPHYYVGDWQVASRIIQWAAWPASPK